MLPATIKYRSFRLRQVRKFSSALANCRPLQSGVAGIASVQTDRRRQLMVLQLGRRWIAIAFAIVMGAALLLAARAFSVPANSPPESKAIRVLFLGDKGPHKPAERAKQLLPYLAARGIEATYTEDINDLRADVLSGYDCLLIYANIESIAPAQEKALLDYVTAGGGFVPVHCASFCFHNSSKYIELVGAEFKSHGGEMFKSKIVDAKHPSMLGLGEFASWDETYVHHKHNTDRRVTMVRENDTGAKAEPYTWTREVGPNGGRVFYTALGHDERTWGEMGFLRLIENGIRWTAKREQSIPAAMRKDAPPLKFVAASAPIPFYPPSDKWGVQGEPLKEMQAPLSPAGSLRYLELPDGFRAELFASEPDIVKVIAKAWDARGRLWVAETVDYPNEQKRPGEGNDRIKICDDTNGDGKADKFTVFADKLSIPTSLVFASGGLIVTQQPDTLFFQDTDGDDKADVRKVLFTGWGTRDTHAGPSNLRYGFDNWIWGIVGYSGFEGTVGGKPIRFGQGIYRFKPDGSAMEFVTSLSNNAWGIGFSETGQIFASTANNDHSVYLAIPNRYYEGVRGWHGLGAKGIAESERYYPITEFHRQMDWHGKFTAAAGHALYTARAFPKWYWNRISFVTEGTGHLIHNDIIEPIGSGYVARNAYNFLASHDEWTSPVTAEVGPDGAVWVSDWYNYIFQHNPTPHGFETGKGNAYVTPLRDKVHGRVYRILYEGNTNAPPQRSRLDNATPDQLVAALGSDNLLWRMIAQRLLVERGQNDVVPALAKLVQDTKIDGIGNSPAALHALWTLKGLGQATAGLALGAFKHPVPAVRKAAIEVCPRDTESTRAILSANLLSDSNAQVRLSAMLALSEMPAGDQEAGKAVAQAMRKPENANDRWIPDAATAAAARHDAGFLSAVLASAREAKAAKPQAAERTDNLLANGSFEEVVGTLPAGWKFQNWQGAADGAVDENEVQVGSRSLRIIASQDGGADSSLSAVVKITPKTNYRLSGRIRTQNLSKANGLGALLNVHEFQSPARVMTPAITGTKDWTRVQTSFNSGERTEITINCLLGGWGKSRGTAWFDDVRLEPIGEGAGAIDTMVRVVTTHYSQGAPAGSIAATLSAARGVDEGTALAVLDGLLAGWPADAALKPDVKVDEALRALSDSLSKDNRARLATLAQRVGRGESFAAESAAATKELVSTMSDESLDVAARLDAARRLLALGDNVQHVDAILKLVTPQSPPAVAAGLTSTLAESRQDAAGVALLKNWKTLPPAARKAAVDVLLRRSAWHTAMLDAMENGTVDRADLSAEQAQQLVTVAADPETAKRAKALLAVGGRLPDADKQKMLDKLLPIANKRGDTANGKAVYEKNCAACHIFAGAGGRVGPDLTGVGKNPRHEILINILDPNRSVEGNFRLWIVQTNDGQTISGRLDTESQTTVELLDAAGKQHVVQRKNIRRMIAQPTSIMPEGFELLPENDLTDLLEFLTQPVEAAPN
jgi:putative membrane-bound dehydrogenase-like protein